MSSPMHSVSSAHATRAGPQAEGSTCCSCLCAKDETRRRRGVVLGAVLMVVSGTGSLAAVLWTAQAEAVYDVTVSYSCLVVVCAWLVGADCVAYYRRWSYAAIADSPRGKKLRASTNPFDVSGGLGFGDDGGLTEESCRTIEEEDAGDEYELGMYGNAHNAWRVPPLQNESESEEEEPMRSNAYD